MEENYNKVNEHEGLAHKSDVDSLRVELSTLRTDIKSWLDVSDARSIERINAVKEGVALALSAADKAVSKAETSSDRRFENFEEYKISSSALARAQIPRSEIEIILKGIEQQINARADSQDKKIGELTSLFNTAIGRGGGQSSVLVYISLGISILIGIVVLIKDFGIK
jgi:hypothetical protein